jgi:signal peptidase I
MTMTAATSDATTQMPPNVRGRPQHATPKIEAPAGTTSEQSAWKFYVNTLTTVMTVLVVMVAAVAIVLAVATHFSTNGEYTVFGHPVKIVLSGSMTPVIKTGDLLVDDQVSATQAEHLHVGQIASFRDTPGSKTIITHRIVGVTRVNGSVAYITKGDANQSADPVPRPASDVVGIFSYAIPRGGYVLNALHQPLVLGLLLASPILWFMAGPLFELARDMDTQDERASRGPATAGDAEADAS